ncbi:MAG: hypothetical protein ABRQ38_11860 [Candidatus Eremiobacterota bacterium]
MLGVQNNTSLSQLQFQGIKQPQAQVLKQPQEQEGKEPSFPGIEQMTKDGVNLSEKAEKYLKDHPNQQVVEYSEVKDGMLDKAYGNMGELRKDDTVLIESSTDVKNGALEADMIRSTTFRNK